MTEDQLYRNYLAGNMSAGDELMLRMGDALVSYLDAFLHSTQDAEDLMLDCFTVLLVDKPKIREGNLRVYLYKMARNKANRLWKTRFRRREFSLDETLGETVPDEKNPPDERAEWREQGDALMRCLNRIAPQYREALWLFYWMDLSYAQCADIMKCKTKRVEDLLRNGKARLRTELEREGITREDF